ncbi:MAG: L-threonylcarbamoyladenylate synthase [Cyanobacteria bacterium J06648_11]
MATTFSLNSEHPQPHTIAQIVKRLRQGDIMLYPTDTVYAIGCDMAHRDAVQRVRKLKQLSNTKPLTFLCQSLSNIASYAQVSDTSYRTMKHLIPGPYTFLLPATKQVPKLVLNPKRKTTGIRVPDSAICQALLTELRSPIVSTSAKMIETESEPPYSPPDLFQQWENQVDIIIDDDRDFRFQVSTVIDMTAADPAIVRRGLGYEEVEHFSDAGSEAWPH